MLLATAYQWEIFVVMFAAGAVAGLYYDVLAAARQKLEAGFFLSLAADLAFGAGAAAIWIAAALAACYGQVRVYEMLAYGLGFLVYMAGPHRALRAAARGVGAALGWFAHLKYIQKFFQ